MSLNPSVLVLAPVGRDASAVAEIASHSGVAATVCADNGMLIDRLGPDCLCVIAAEEGLFNNDLTRLIDWAASQPPWSDLPFVILTTQQPHAQLHKWRTELVRSLGNVTLIERPIHVLTLTSAIETAVRARKRQYELQQLLSELEQGNERFRLIVDHALDYAIIFSDPDDKITAWLPGAEAVFGWSESEMLGRPVASIFTPADQASGIPQQELANARAHGEAPNIRWHATKRNGRKFLDGKTVVLREGDKQVRGYLKIGKDVTERQRNEERQAVLLAELQHRVRNVLAVISSLVKRSDAGGTAKDYQERLSGRIGAMARTQALLTRAAGIGVDLAGMITDELVAQAANENQISVEGPIVTLAPKAAEVLTLAIHELATNASKYGAIRDPVGRIDVRWQQDVLDGQRWLQFDWRESGIEIDDHSAFRKGFGTELITRRVPYELEGRGELAFTRDGVRCRISFPLRDGESILQTAVPAPEQVT